MARKPKEFDKANFEKLCTLQCTRDEICFFFETTDKTLNSWCKRTYKKPFLEVYDQKRQSGFISLRRMQFELAKKNVFLGKSYLGQKGRQKMEIQMDSSSEALKSSAEQMEDYKDKEK